MIEAVVFDWAGTTVDRIGNIGEIYQEDIEKLIQIIGDFLAEKREAK